MKLFDIHKGRGMCLSIFAATLAVQLPGAPPATVAPGREEWRPQLSAPKYKVKTQFNVMVPMRDGVKLAIDIYMPDAPGPFPVILTRTPYNKNGTSVDQRTYYAKRGYVAVYQDVRGRYESEGQFYTWHNEANDGYDTLEWIGKQQWCSGKIGMAGGSYLGLSQWLAAAKRSQYLKAIVPRVAPSDFYDQLNYTKGAFQLGVNAAWGMGQAGRSAQDTKQFDWNALYRYLPLIDLYKSVGHDAKYYDDWLKHPDDDSYWKEISNYELFREIEIPTYSFGGWYDIFSKAPFENYNGMREHGRTPSARQSSKLVVGPWMHGLTNPGTTKIADIDFGAGSLLDLSAYELRWFDYWLKGVQNGIMNEPPIRFFVMGANAWRDENEWPLKKTQFVKYYLRSGRLANSLAGDGSLTPEAASSGNPYDTFDYDPANPVPTLGGQICCMPVPAGPYDQRPAERRDDVLVYTSGALTHDTEVSGPITAKIYASSSAVDTDFTVKLVDVYPDGYAQILTEGIVKASHRESLAQPKPIEPGRIYEYDIDVWATANVFRTGHRIRVDVSSSNFPRFARNLNTGEPIATGVRMVVANQKVYHDAQHPSAVILPITSPD